MSVHYMGLNFPNMQIFPTWTVSVTNTTASWLTVTSPAYPIVNTSDTYINYVVKVIEKDAEGFIEDLI